IVSVMNDPVGRGLVASLNSPGGNITGVDMLVVEVAPKRLEFMHEAVPNARKIALLLNPTGSNAENQARDLHAAAATLGIHLQVLYANKDADFAPVFAKLAELQAGGLVIGSDAFFAERYEQLAALALLSRMPAIFQNREFALAGGLMSYGSEA